MQLRTAFCVVIAVGIGLRMAQCADPPAPPPASRFAPADEVDVLVGEYVGKLRETLKDQQAFEAGKPRLKKDANTLAVLAMVAGLHDTPNPVQKSAAEVAHAAVRLAQANDYAAAKSTLEQIESALGQEHGAAEKLTWGKLGSLGQLMKQVTFVHARLKRSARPGPRFEAGAAEAARYATTLAVIGQATAFDTQDVKDPAELGKWFDYCAAMRDSAAQAAAALRQRDAPAAQAALKNLEQSCNNCHKTFRVETTE